MNNQDKLAKLLATENISIDRSNVKTASFDVKNRVLTLPTWKNMTDNIETMLIGHEVGHALYTFPEMLEETKDTPSLHSYINVIEDVRIEKLMKRKFPGLRKDFTAGYRELNERDFFGLGQMNIEALRLIDKINVYFKVGLSAGVKFNTEEKTFLVRAEKTESPKDVIQLAKDIYEYSLEKQKEKDAEHEEEELDQLDDIFEEEDEEDDSYADDMVDSDEEQDELESEVPSFAGNDTDDFDKDVQPITQRMLDEKLASSADTNKKYVYWDMNLNYKHDMIIGHKKILSDLDKTNILTAEGSFDVNDYDQFMVDNNKVVNYLVKEFEMKKSAQAYKRSYISKAGSLDMKKLWGYKLNDDIFRKITIVPEGKNHGMIFLLDWSGSMYEYLKDTVKQLIALTSFCRRVQIPFQVLAFTDSLSSDIYNLYESENKSRYEEMNACDSLNKVYPDEQRFRLLEFLSSTMSNSDYNKMTKYLLCNQIVYSDRSSYGLGGTPLNQALQYMVKYVPEFISKNNIEKTTFVTLTDGDAGGNIHIRTSEYTAEGRVDIENLLRDPITKKDFDITNIGSDQTQMWLKVIKARYNVNIVGFHITKNNRRNLWDTIRINRTWDKAYNSDDEISLMKKSFREHGFYSFGNTVRDESFVIPTSALKINNEELEVEEGLSTHQIYRRFSKSLKTKKTSRVLLDKLINVIA